MATSFTDNFGGLGPFGAQDGGFNNSRAMPSQGYAPSSQSSPYPSSSAVFDEYANEPPLLEELGVNFSAIGTKTTAVLMLHRPISPEVLLDADLAGPLVFCVVLGLCLLLVRAQLCTPLPPAPRWGWWVPLLLRSCTAHLTPHAPLSPAPALGAPQSGKLHFGYIYGFGLLGCCGMYLLVNLMQGNAPAAAAAEGGSLGDAPTRLGLTLTVSMLGYCLLPIVLLAALAVFFSLHGVQGVVLGLAAILWSTLSCARFFEVALRMSDRKWLIAYPAGLFYACFALMVRLRARGREWGWGWWAEIATAQGIQTNCTPQLPRAPPPCTRRPFFEAAGRTRHAAPIQAGWAGRSATPLSLHAPAIRRKHGWDPQCAGGARDLHRPRAPGPCESGLRGGGRGGAPPPPAPHTTPQCHQRGGLLYARGASFLGGGALSSSSSASRALWILLCR